MPKVSSNPYFKNTQNNLKNVVSCYTVCLKWNVNKQYQFIQWRLRNNTAHQIKGDKFIKTFSEICKI